MRKKEEEEEEETGRKYICRHPAVQGGHKLASPHGVHTP